MGDLLKRADTFVGRNFGRVLFYTSTLFAAALWNFGGHATSWFVLAFAFLTLAQKYDERHAPKEMHGDE